MRTSIIEENKFRIIGFIVLFITIFIFIYNHVGNVNNIRITAHRGASAVYPENTISAFKGAMELNTDYIELDVQQTKDRKIVVFHDKDLKRIANINKKIKDLNYDDLSQIDIGSYFNEKYKDERIPLLSDVLELVKDSNVILNIELKVNDKDRNFEKQVIYLLNQYNMLDRCVVASQNYESVKKIENLDNNIKTVYVTSKLDNDVSSYEVDVLSLNYTIINPFLVDDIHQNNKEVYAWTVDDENVANLMIMFNVDNIITNDVELIQNVINKRR
jgi:glycerophosphoryl diester phosphodiesterase